LSSSKPDFFVIFSRSERIMLTAFVTIARVMAISRMISTKRVRLCFIALRMGPMAICVSLYEWAVVSGQWSGGRRRPDH
jgi:hypothetical protein